MTADNEAITVPTITDSTFTMSKSNVVLTALWTQNATTPTTNGGNGGTTSTNTGNNAGAVLGATRTAETVIPEQGEVLGAVRSAKTSDESKAFLWFLLMSGSAVGAITVLTKKKEELE